MLPLIKFNVNKLGLLKGFYSFEEKLQTKPLLHIQ